MSYLETNFYYETIIGLISISIGIINLFFRIDDKNNDVILYAWDNHFAYRFTLLFMVYTLLIISSSAFISIYLIYDSINVLNIFIKHGMKSKTIEGTEISLIISSIFILTGFYSAYYKVYKKDKPKKEKFINWYNQFIKGIMKIGMNTNDFSEKFNESIKYDNKYILINLYQFSIYISILFILWISNISHIKSNYLNFLNIFLIFIVDDWFIINRFKNILNGKYFLIDRLKVLIINLFLISLSILVLYQMKDYNHLIMTILLSS